MGSPEVRQHKMIEEPGHDVHDEILDEILSCDSSQVPPADWVKKQIILSPERRRRLVSPSALDSDLISMSPKRTFEGNEDVDIQRMHQLQRFMIDKQRGLIRDVEHHGKQIKEIDAGQDVANKRALEALTLARRFKDVSLGQSELEGDVATQFESVKAFDSRFQRDLSLARIVSEHSSGVCGILRTHVETVHDGMVRLETRMAMRDKAVLTRIYQFNAFILALLVVVVAVQVKFFWF